MLIPERPEGPSRDGWKSYCLEIIAAPRMRAGATWAAFAAPLLLYISFAFRYSLNVPVHDDYGAALEFLNRFAATGSWIEKAALIFSQHNEHRIVLDRLVFLAQHLLFGRIDFRLSILAGNLGWMLTVGMLLVYAARKTRLPIAWLAPLPALLFSLTHYENTFMAMGSLQNYWSMAFALGCLIAIAETRTVSACVLFPLSLFTSGGAIVLLPLGIGFLLLRREWRALAWFSVFGLAAAGLYFHGFERPAYHPPPADAVAAPLRAIAYFLVFWGGLLPVKGAALLAGLSGVLLAVFLMARRQGPAALHLTLLFVGLNAAAAALFRSPFGVMQAAASRYAIFSLLAWSCLYVLALPSLPEKWRGKAALLATLAALTYCGLGAAAFTWKGIFAAREASLLEGMSAFRQGDPSGLWFPDPEHAARILRNSERLGVYEY